VESFSWRALISFLGLCFVLPSPTGAASVNKDLEGIKSKIEREKRGLSQLQKKEGSVLQSLGKIESELDKRSAELNTTRARLNSIVGEMANKEAEAAQLRASLTRRQELLKKRAAALYRWHRWASPLILLNGDVSLGKFLQRKRYLAATISFDRDLVRNFADEAQRQDALREELAHKRVDLDNQRQALGEAQNAVRKEAEKKKQLLASVRQEKATRARALREMEAAAERLQKMMEEISRRSVSKPSEVPAGLGLEALRGRLDWPVKGEVVNAFGKSQHPEFAAEVFRKGIDIEAPLGEAIKAVEKGKIVYADRFAGYGRMMIVDHGQRYFTIYGHLSEILKKNGDEVKRGEILGRVGDSDSLAGVKLYFEMRKDGHSIDPMPWFRK
jgi:septal ring factor EnvC (AmiA/AmiB activator)